MVGSVTVEVTEVVATPDVDTVDQGDMTISNRSTT